MKDFKLIAIRPLAGCNKKFTKILKEGTPYVFYNEYDFSKYGDNSKSITIKTDLIPDLYSFENNSGQDIKISISAIVGENGSGKSSIVELFYVACYNISVIKKVLFDEETEKPVALKNIVSDIKIEIFYKIDNDIYLLSLVGTKIKIFKLIDKSFKNANDIAFDLNNFFYTISINYSLHSLNSNVFGDWINRIFHKNDGYQTPIVLNPFRNKGNIEINNEEYLVKSRMISNILGKIDTRTKPSDSLRNVLDKKVAYKLKVELNREKFNYKAGEPIFENIEEIGEKILPLVYKYFLNDYNFIPKDTPLNKYAKEYILSKVKSIANKYQPYKRFSTFLDKNHCCPRKKLREV